VPQILEVIAAAGASKEGDLIVLEVLEWISAVISTFRVSSPKILLDSEFCHFVQNPQQNRLGMRYWNLKFQSNG
jgi:hypothetical protein